MCRKVQRHIHDLVSAAQRVVRVGDSSGDSSSAAAEAGVGSAEEVPAHQATAEAVRQCALLRKLLIALALARPSPDKVMQLLATSKEAPPTLWQQAVERLRPTVTRQQCQELARARASWLRTMGPLLARLGFQLGRPALQTWQAAFIVLQDLPATAEQQQQVLVSTPATPSASAVPAAGGSGGVSASTAPPAAQPIGSPQQRAYPASMQQAGRQRQSMQRELRYLSDSFQQAWLCLVTFLMSSIQVMTLWQCAVVLAACTPHFPDLVSVAAHLVDAPLPPHHQQQQQAAFEEFSRPAGRGRG